MEDTKKTQIKLQEMKYAISEMNNTLAEINAVSIKTAIKTKQTLKKELKK